MRGIKKTDTSPPVPEGLVLSGTGDGDIRAHTRSSTRLGQYQYLVCEEDQRVWENIGRYRPGEMYDSFVRLSARRSRKIIARNTWEDIQRTERT